MFDPLTFSCLATLRAFVEACGTQLSDHLAQSQIIPNHRIALIRAQGVHEYEFASESQDRLALSLVMLKAYGLLVKEQAAGGLVVFASSPPKTKNRHLLIIGFSLSHTVAGIVPLRREHGILRCGPLSTILAESNSSWSQIERKLRATAKRKGGHQA
jgi:hypothetical protein